jgi:hypothetical protein
MRDDRKLDSEAPLARTFMTARFSRRQVLKTSLFGMGSLAMARGLAPLESLAAAPASMGRWRQIFPPSAPSPRGSAAMAYDGGRRAPVLFSGGADADTWTWNGLTWNRQSLPLSPSARYGASFAYYPPTDTLVLFGGGSAKGFLADTWLWNGIAWTEVPGAGPPARLGASMSFDPTSGSLILFGGYGPSGRFNGTFDDTWMWKGASWIRPAPSASPPGRSGTSLAYDSVIGKLILFGGKRSPMGVPEPEATWAWDGANWSEVPLGPAPPWRFHASMAARPEGGPILLFGGVALADGSFLGDTWTLGSNWSADTQAPTPSPRAGASLVPDPSNNALLLFGGGAAPGHLLGDTWVWEFS